MTDSSIGGIDDQAAAWAARMLSGSVTESDRLTLDAWLSEHQDHRDAYGEYMDIADLVGGASSGPSEQLLERELHEFARDEAKSSKRLYWYAAPPAIAASLAAVLFVSGVFRPAAAPAERYETARGQISEIMLADNSRITLNTDTVLEVRFSEDERQVVLEKGEALFEVVSDADRPFIVDAVNTEVRVLGTSFSIRALEENTTVSVLTGTVQVSLQASGDGEADVATLSAGQEIMNAVSLGLGKAYSIRIENAAAWRRGEVYYENKPLTDVIADLNRYYQVPIVLGDERLSSIPVTGGFDVNNQDVTVEALSVALSLRFERLPSGVIMLSPS